MVFKTKLQASKQAKRACTVAATYVTFGLCPGTMPNFSFPQLASHFNCCLQLAYMFWTQLSVSLCQ